MSPKPADLELNTCELEGCDEKITWMKYDSLNSYLKKKFCGRSCAITYGRWNGSKTPGEKPCKACGETMYRRDNEKANRFTERMACSDKCRNDLRQAQLKARNAQGGTWKRTNNELFQQDPKKAPPIVAGKRTPVPVNRVAPGETWRPVGFSATPKVPDHIRRLREGDAA